MTSTVLSLPMALLREAKLVLQLHVKPKTEKKTEAFWQASKVTNGRAPQNGTGRFA
jgi:hypothetical protein